MWADICEVVCIMAPSFSIVVMFGILLSIAVIYFDSYKGA
jgi:hypothetical protein